MMFLDPTFLMFAIMIGLVVYSAWTDHTTMRLLNSTNICIAITGLAGILVFPERPSLIGIGIGLASGLAALAAGWALSKPLKTDDSVIGFLVMVIAVFGIFLGGSWYASNFAAITEGDIQAWKDLASAAIVTLGALAFLHAALKMGAGDIKYLAALSIWFGSQYNLDFILISAVLGGVLAILTKVAIAAKPYDRWSIVDRALPFLAIGKGRTIPYGVSISLAALYVIFWEQAQGLGVN